MCCRAVRRRRSRSARSTCRKWRCASTGSASATSLRCCAAGSSGGALTGFDETALAGQTGELVWEGTGEIVPELNRDVVTALPVGEAVAGLAPGLYAMTARVPGALREDYENLPTQWFVVTDLGLATLSGADGLNVFVRALSSAQAVAGVEVALVARNNEVLGTAASDADGRVRFDPGLLRGRGGAEAALVTAELGDDFAFLSLTEPPFDLSDRGVEGRAAPPPVDVFVTTERGAYRPGETVHATVLTRDARAAAVTGLPLTAIVTRPDGVEHTREVLADAGAGGRVMALALDAGAQRGTWRMRLHADPEAPALAVASWLVEDFVPERIDFALTLPEGPVAAGDRPVLAVEARYLWGAPGAGLAVEGEVTLAPGRELPGFGGYVFGLEDEPFRSGFAGLPRGLVTDAEGRAEIALPVPEAAPGTRPMVLGAVLRMAEGSGRPVERSLSRPLAPASPLIGIRPLFEGAVDEGGTAGFELIGVGEDLTRRALGPVDWVLNRVETSYQWYEIGGNWNYEPVTRRTRVASGTVEIGAGAPARLDLAGRLGAPRAAARRRRHGGEPGVQRGLVSGGGGGGDAGRAGGEPRPGGLWPRRDRAAAGGGARGGAAAGQRARRPAGGFPGAGGRGRRDGGRAAGDG
jgi:alpha-2-macroglobulin